MTRFAVIETDFGLAVMRIPPNVTVEDVAAEQGGSIVDPGPFDSYDEAYDAMLAVPDEDDERDAARE